MHGVNEMFTLLRQGFTQAGLCLKKNRIYRVRRVIKQAGGWGIDAKFVGVT
jgi:hypothetical protein